MAAGAIVPDQAIVLTPQQVGALDEDAGQLVADGLVDQEGCDGAVDAAAGARGFTSGLEMRLVPDPV
ncbi:hypothetical protein ACC731_37540, partial [Rhizobium ruizarguesonis]